MKNELNGRDGTFPVADGVWGMRHVFVNSYIIKSETNDNWVLVDAGLKWSAPKIKKAAATLFGPDSRPKAIILTHGHFDHVGSVAALAEEWDVPVYAHFMEIPYLTGKSSYPPPDPSVGGGLMASMSFVYPKSPINIWSRINVLSSDGNIPALPEWKYIHTPGHSPGHISLFREGDKVLIAGDAFVTINAGSAISSLITQKKQISGPPKYFTYDWNASEQSVQALADLQPRLAVTGHGQPMHGAELRDALLELTQHFNTVAVPAQGRYVDEPAVADTNGVIYIPALVETNDHSLIIKTAAVTAGLVVAMMIRKKKIKKKKETEYLLDFEYNF